MEQINLSPSPTSLIESMRDIGYSVETAIADLIDNSITANAKTIDIRFNATFATPWVAVVDDGNGMCREELISSMKLGSQNPLQARNENDLGRFGLGLKTASFSQCRCLTVLSKKDNSLSCARWDLDLLSIDQNEQWTLCLLSATEIEEHSVLSKLNNEYLNPATSGTIVLWENIDRLSEAASNNNIEKQYDEAIANTRKHLELVFHRFLSPSFGKAKTLISINKSELLAFDPFYTKKSTELREENFEFDGQKILVQPFVLPHHNKIGKAEWKKYAGKLGYLHEQGFYIYRNKRLIIHATWFRLIKKEELTKLLRVRVDIPNTLDHLWKIDIKKSSAAPPAGIKEELKRIIGKIELSGKKVYRQRGQAIRNKVTHPVWIRIAKENQIFYELNRKHPVLAQFVQSQNKGMGTSPEDILSLIETTFPRDTFYHDAASSPEQMNEIQVDINLLKTLCKHWFHNTSMPISKSELSQLAVIEPFASNFEVTKKALKELGFEFQT